MFFSLSHSPFYIAKRKTPGFPEASAIIAVVVAAMIVISSWCSVTNSFSCFDKLLFFHKKSNLKHHPRDVSNCNSTILYSSLDSNALLTVLRLVALCPYLSTSLPFL